MKYKYSSTPPPDSSKTWIKRPVLQIEIFGPKESKKFNALIDSGADCSLFNIQVAKALGFDLTRAKESSVVGVGGTKPLFTYLFENVEVKIECFDKKIKIPVNFIDSDSVGLLLGEEGFFDQHRIKFEKDHDIFEISSIKN
jgi:hypothetical protein